MCTAYRETLPIFVIPKFTIGFLPNFAHLLGRVVIGSLIVYQAIGAGSNPVVSTTVLGVSTRTIGVNLISCLSFAWGSLGRPGLEVKLPSLQRYLDSCEKKYYLFVGHF